MHRQAIRDRLQELNWSVLRLSNESKVRYATLTEFINSDKGISIDNLEKVLKVLELNIKE